MKKIKNLKLSLVMFVIFACGVALGSLVVQSATESGGNVVIEGSPNFCEPNDIATLQGAISRCFEDEPTLETSALISTVTGEEVTLSQTAINELGSMSYSLEMAEKIVDGVWAACTVSGSYPERLPTVLEVALEINKGTFDHWHLFMLTK